MDIQASLQPKPAMDIKESKKHLTQDRCQQGLGSSPSLVANSSQHFATKSNCFVAVCTGSTSPRPTYTAKACMA